MRCDCSVWAGVPAGSLCPICNWSRCLEDHQGWFPTAGVECSACAEKENDRPKAAAPGDAPAPTKAAPCEAEGSTAPPARVASRRMVRNYRTKPTVFVAWPATVRELLELVGDDVERVYLIGDRPDQTAAGVRAWATGELPPGWSHGEAGHYTTGGSPVLRYTRRGRSLEVHRAASWFGDGPIDEDDAGEAWRLLERLCERTFDRGQLLSTPSTTGRYLWSRTLPDGAEWPVLPDELQERIRSTSGQGRIELLELEADELPALVEYDGRIMYGALCWGLAGGQARHDTGDTFAGQQRGRYRVTYEVPRDWSHVGLLPAANEDGPGWRYPRRPGELAGAWVDGAELAIAIQQGWRVRIHERILFDGYRGTAGPLDKWARLLLEAREKVTRAVEAGRMTAPVGELVAAGVRAILIASIGAFHGRPRKVTRASTRIEDVPAHAEGRHVIDGTTYVWTELERSGWSHMAHPEWSSAIWARARARLLRCPTGRRGEYAGALSVPASTVLAMRTDALYLTADPEWHDDGAAGRLRRKEVIGGPIPTPRTTAELLELRGA